MRPLISFAMSMFMAMTIYAQQDTIYTYYSDTPIYAFTDLCIDREIKGGTKFIVNFEGTWDKDMEGAFLYACKIWEENLPTMLPLKITAKIGSLRGNSSLSKIKVGRLSSFTKASHPQARFLMMEEYNRRCNYFFTTRQDSLELDSLPDIEITYNVNLLNTDNVSFSLDGTTSAKIDFVTQALRDIAAGLGFGTSFVPYNNQLQLYGAVTYTGLEKLVKSAIGTYDGSLAYQRATQGSLAITIPNYGTLYLYAPSPWVQRLSLNTFYPSEGSGLSQLLTYNYGKGTVIRDITDDYYALFYYGFGWQYSLTTGPTPSSVDYRNCDNSNPTAYHGTITETSMDFISSGLGDLQASDLSLAIKQTALFPLRDGYEEPYDYLSYCKPYDPTLSMNGIINYEGWTFSILKKDGTWDIVYQASSGVTYFVLDLSNVTFHYPDEQYARTADNYLRGRLTYNLRHWDNLYSRYYNDCKCKYYALDYVPQKVEMNIAKEYEDSHLLDEYLRDIDIAMRNLEGATQVYVEQLEEGDLYPSVTAFSNFKSARYLATVDKEYASDFTVVSYNNNGHKTSEVLSVPAISPAQLYLNITGGRIIATYGHKRKRVKNMQYTILFSPNNSSSLTMAKWGNSIDGCIYLSDLENGLNIVKVTLPNGKTASIAVNK